MIIEKFSVKAQDVIESACRLAVKKDHEYVTPWHMLSVMLEPKAYLTRTYLSQTKIDLEALGARVDGKLLTQPKAKTDSQQTPLNRDLERLFILAEEASVSTGEKDIGINHILLGMLKTEEIFEAFSDAGTNREELETLLKQPPRSRFSAGEGGTGDFEYLARYTLDLTERARQGELDPIIGREQEIRLAIQVLSRRLKNNPIIIGEPGVGKTAIVEGLAQRIINGDVPDDLKPTAILSLDMGQLIAGDKKTSLLLSGNGDIIEPEDGILGTGSGGPYAVAAARALLVHTDMSPGPIVEEALRIAAKICIYTNDNIIIEKLDIK